ncbi:hypothetical protein Syun_004138 [Stephania yunnanensis]|uniref:Uncharacterized protein n=1 Tax=Stephania yunnanensis TaxID=152371 RepID=A0AAP0L2K3_9MAGN
MIGMGLMAGKSWKHGLDRMSGMGLNILGDMAELDVAEVSMGSLSSLVFGVGFAGNFRALDLEDNGSYWLRNVVEEGDEDAWHARGENRIVDILGVGIASILWKIKGSGMRKNYVDVHLEASEDLVPHLY